MRILVILLIINLILVLGNVAMIRLTYELLMDVNNMTKEVLKRRE